MRMGCGNQVFKRDTMNLGVYLTQSFAAEVKILFHFGIKTVYSTFLILFFHSASRRIYDV